MSGSSEHQFFCEVFRLLRETDYTVIMKGIDFPTGPRKDFVRQILLNHLAGEDDITSKYISVGVVASESDTEKVSTLEQAIDKPGRLWVGLVPEEIPVGYMIMDGEIGYMWNTTQSTPYEPERGVVPLRAIFAADAVVSRWQKDFYEIAERTPQSKEIMVRHQFG